MIESRSLGVLDGPPSRGMTTLLWLIRDQNEALAPQRLQAFEREALRIADTGQIELADKGGGRGAVALGQRHDGVDGNSLGVHGLPRAVRGRKPRSVQGHRLIRR